jgi:hypothetical protein
MDWKPITDKEKDGRRLLIWAGYSAFAIWSDKCQFGQFVCKPGWQIFDCDDDSYYSYGEEEYAVTHFAEVPEGPND